MRLGALAHDLPVHLAVGGNIDDQIADHPRLAAEPTSSRKGSPLRGIALLDGIEAGHVRFARLDRDLGIVPFLHDNLTAAANAAATADAVEIDAKLARRLENRGSRRKIAALA